MLLCFHDPEVPYYISKDLYYSLEDFQKLFGRIKSNAQTLCKEIPNVVDHGRHDSTTYEQDKLLSEKMEQKFVTVRPTYDALHRDAWLVDQIRIEYVLSFCRSDNHEPFFQVAVGGPDPLFAVEEALNEYLSTHPCDFTYSGFNGVTYLIEDFCQTCCIKEENDKLLFEYPDDFLYQGEGMRTDTEEVRKEHLQNIINYCDEQSAKIAEFFAQAEKVVADHGVSENTSAAS